MGSDSREYGQTSLVSSLYSQPQDMDSEGNITGITLEPKGV